MMVKAARRTGQAVAECWLFSAQFSQVQRLMRLRLLGIYGGRAATLGCILDKYRQPFANTRAEQKRQPPRCIAQRSAATETRHPSCPVG
jgi:hypothetical protein